MLKASNANLDDVIRIEQETQRKAASSVWKGARNWWLTASCFGEICKATNKRDMTSLAAQIFSPPQLMSDAINHGRAHKQIAIEKFCEMTGKTVSKCRLFVDIELPFLAASPDGIVNNEKSIIEVKCPYNGRNSNIEKGKLFPHLQRREMATMD